MFPYKLFSKSKTIEYMKEHRALHINNGSDFQYRAWTNVSVYTSRICRKDVELEPSQR